jgi:hypothetical protein
MRKTILFPTDFSLESLNFIKSVLLSKETGQEFDIVLVHGIESGDSIVDLLFFSKDKVLSELMSPEFTEACNIIKSRFESKLRFIRKEIFTGSTRISFQNFLDSNGISEAFIPVNYDFKKVNKKSFDILPFIKGSRVTVNSVEWNSGLAIPERGKPAEVFVNSMALN